MNSKLYAVGTETKIHTEQPLLTYPSYIELKVFYELETSIIGGLEVLVPACVVFEKKRFQGGKISFESSIQVGYRETRQGW